MEEKYIHPKLGGLYQEDVDWQTDEVTVSFCKAPIGVCLANGSDDGPSAMALDGFEWVETHWDEVLAIIQDQAFEFYDPYFDAFEDIPKFDSANDLWGTGILLYLRLFSKTDFTVSMRFAWQKEEDSHQVTFEVEEGECFTHTVDG